MRKKEWAEGNLTVDNYMVTGDPVNNHTIQINLEGRMAWKGAQYEREDCFYYKNGKP